MKICTYIKNQFTWKFSHSINVYTIKMYEENLKNIYYMLFIIGKVLSKKGKLFSGWKIKDTRNEYY